MNQKTKILEEYNDKLSSIYDKATKHDWKAPSVMTKLSTPFLKKRNKILDIGVGTGQSAIVFYKKGCKVVGVDISKKMISIAKVKMPKGHFSTFNIEKIKKFSSKKFDAIISSGVFEFIENLDKIFEFASENIKNNGYFCFTFEEYLPKTKTQKWRIAELGKGFMKPIPKSHSFIVYRRSLLEVEKMLKKNGFQVLKKMKFNAYHKTIKIPVIYRIILAKKI